MYGRTWLSHSLGIDSVYLEGMAQGKGLNAQAYGARDPAGKKSPRWLPQVEHTTSVPPGVHTVLLPFLAQVPLATQLPFPWNAGHLVPRECFFGRVGMCESSGDNQIVTSAVES